MGENKAEEAQPEKDSEQGPQDAESRFVRHSTHMLLSAPHDKPSSTLESILFMLTISLFAAGLNRRLTSSSATKAFRGRSVSGAINTWGGGGSYLFCVALYRM